MRPLNLSLRLILCLTAVVGADVLLSHQSAIAADSVVLKYSILRESISVPELTTFAETGELSSSLQSYLKMAGKDPNDVRQSLTKEVNVNARLLDRVLNSPVGELVLDQISEVIQTSDGGASRQSLRGALMSSALPDGKITLIETLQKYPTSEVHVDGNRLVEAYKKISQLGNPLQNLENLIKIR